VAGIRDNPGDRVGMMKRCRREEPSVRRVNEKECS
jgi:hypothetical protein